MKIKFENDFQKKIMVQSFDEPTVLDTPEQVRAWRSLWTGELKSWHSPYRLIIDCNNLNVTSSPKVQEELQRMFKFFEGLFLKSALGFKSQSEENNGFPFEILPTFEAVQERFGISGVRAPATPEDFRSAIQIQNHFAQHVIEVGFTVPVVIDSREKVEAFKSKLTNNLMQWHSKWSLLIDCTNLDFSKDIEPDWQKIEKFFTGFFMKAVVGYSPAAQNREHFPFPTFRARHVAVAKLENEGHFMGNDAHCRSSKST